MAKYIKLLPILRSGSNLGNVTVNLTVNVNFNDGSVFVENLSIPNPFNTLEA